jgi:hypothetical protein
MDELLARPELADVDSIELVCQPELIELYARWGLQRCGRAIAAHAPHAKRALGRRQQ